MQSVTILLLFLDLCFVLAWTAEAAEIEQSISRELARIDDYCQLFLDLDSFNCTCDGNIPEVIDANTPPETIYIDVDCSADGVFCQEDPEEDHCGYYSFYQDSQGFDPLVSRSCINYTTVFESSEYCLTLNYANREGLVSDLSNISSCSATGNSVPCDSCTVCDDQNSVSVDCSNIEAEAVTNGCISAEAGMGLFPDFTKPPPSGAASPVYSLGILAMLFLSFSFI